MSKANQPSSARRAALRLLGRVLGQGIPLNEPGDVIDALPGPARAAAQRLANLTLRHLGRADRLLEPYLKKPPPLPIQNILRLGTVELCNGGAAHGVVHDCVGLAGAEKGGTRFRGLVNAVLRKVAKHGVAAWPKATPTQLPAYLRRSLVQAWGRDAVTAMEATFAQTPPVDLTARSDPAALAEIVNGTLLPTGSVRLAQATQISNLPGYETGAFWVQDAAAAMPVQLLGDLSGLRALDLCAAPGGKTLQLAAAGATVTALDISKKRLRRVQENLARTQLSAELVAQDARAHKGQYDVVLLDAPCSATGTLRRHPDLPFVHQDQGLETPTALQSELLDHALRLLAPGGRLVYATCSLLPEEGEAQITAALARHPSLRTVLPDVDWIAPDWRSAEGGLRLRPDFWADRGGMDGFYMACLLQTG